MVEEDFEGSTISAIAQAIVSAIVDDSECTVDVDAQAETRVCQGDCIRGRGRQCGGFGMDKVHGCCDVGYSCYQRSSWSRTYTCQKDTSTFARFWTVVECDKA